MNKGLKMLLKSFGIEISDEDIQKLSELIPKLPALVNDCIRAINTTISRADQRLHALEHRLEVQDKILAKLLEVTLKERVNDGSNTSGDNPTGISDAPGPGTGKPNGFGV